MSILWRYSLVIGGTLLLPISSARAVESSSEVYEVTAQAVPSDSTSAHNLASTRVDAKALRAAGVTSSEQFSRVLPGLHMENSGSLLFPSLSLRGVSSAQDPYNPALTLYVDGVPQLSTNTVQALTDVESVEMLRGPQGTLFGKSAQGGIIAVKSRRPTNTPYGYIEGGTGSRGSYRSKTYVSGPLKKGMLYGSITLLRQVDGGDMTNPATGHSGLGDKQATTGNVRVLIAPSEKPWTIGLTATRECSRATQDTYVPFGSAHQRTLSIAPGLPDPYLSRCTNSQALTSTYTTDAWTFSLISAWQRQHYDRSFPNGTLIANVPEHWRQNVQEIRATSDPERGSIAMVWGLYRQDTGEALNQRYDTAAGSLLATQSHTSANTLAAYTNLTWQLTDRFDIGSGVRVSHDTARTRYAGTAQNTPFEGHNTHSDNRLLGQLSTGYLVNDDWRVYARTAQGYKPSGFNIIPSPYAPPAPFLAEISTNYEVGAHYDTEAVHLQGAIFYTHTKDMQLYSGPQGLQTLTNAGAADASGAELEATWHVTPNWVGEINGSVIHAVFTGDSGHYADQRTPFTPRYTLGGSISGDIDTPYGALQPHLAGHAVGSHYFDSSNQLHQGAYATLDARLGLQATHRLNVELFVDNLFDRRYFTYGYLNGTSAFGQVNGGRTVGVNVHATLF